VSDQKRKPTHLALVKQGDTGDDPLRALEDDHFFGAVVDHIRAEKITAIDDPRFTLSLLAGVITVLEKHGYKQAGHAAVAETLRALLHLVRAFEGEDV
jgi:hypothetical protein